MLDKNCEYVRKYIEQIDQLKSDIFNQEYLHLPEVNVRIVKELDREWKYRVVKDIDSKIYLNNFYSEEIKNLIYDENILNVTIQSIPSQHFIDPHVDGQAHERNVWRILFPIKSDNFLLRRNGKTDFLKVGECYEIDYTYEVHSSWNLSKTESFVVWIFDIFYPDDSKYDQSKRTVRGMNINSRTKMDDIDRYFYINTF